MFSCILGLWDAQNLQFYCIYLSSRHIWKQNTKGRCVSASKLSEIRLYKCNSRWNEPIKNEKNILLEMIWFDSAYWIYLRLTKYDIFFDRRNVIFVLDVTKCYVYLIQIILMLVYLLCVSAYESNVI